MCTFSSPSLTILCCCAAYNVLSIGCGREEGGAAMATRITQLVNVTLQAELGQGGPLTEEQVLELIDTGASPGGPAGRHWVLDPIDGTRGFVGLRQYAICLGMLQEGQVSAALHHPAQPPRPHSPSPRHIYAPGRHLFLSST